LLACDGFWDKLDGVLTAREREPLPAGRELSVEAPDCLVLGEPFVVRAVITDGDPGELQLHLHNDVVGDRVERLVSTRGGVHEARIEGLAPGGYTWRVTSSSDQSVQEVRDVLGVVYPNRDLRPVGGRRADLD
jgi:hypothetical protein